MFRASDIFNRGTGNTVRKPAQAKAGATQKRKPTNLEPSQSPNAIRQWDPATGAFFEQDIPAEVMELMRQSKRLKPDMGMHVKQEPGLKVKTELGAPGATGPDGQAAAPKPSIRRPRGLIVRFGGFGKQELNLSYAERSGEEIQGRASYWDPQMQYFVYWQRSARRWAVCDFASVGAAKSGLAPGWAYKADSTHFALPGKWMEAWGREWRPAAPVCTVLQGEVQEEEPELIKAELPDGRETELSSEQYQDLVRKLYELHNPDKLPDVDGFLAKYVGREDQLFDLICVKYEVDKQEFLAEALAGTAAVAEEAADTAADEDADAGEVPELSPREYAILVQSVYERYNPAKLSDMGRLLKRYRHEMRQLYYDVCKKYGINAAAYWAERQAQPEGEEAASAAAHTAAPV